jgi:hypothetical protein
MSFPYDKLSIVVAVLVLVVFTDKMHKEIADNSSPPSKQKPPHHKH